MGRVYAVVNQKGGVGKTTTAVNVAAFLALSGCRVLLVDMDPQGNATSGVGTDKNRIGRPGSSVCTSMYDVLVNQVPASDSLTATPVQNLDLLPANLDLAAAELELIPRLARETILRDALAPLRGQYDFILADAPPSLGVLTTNAMAAADALIIPIQCEYYALEGVSQLLRMVDMVRRHVNPGLEIGLVLMTMYDHRVRLNRQVEEEVKRAFGAMVAQRPIPRNVRVAEAPSHGMPVALYDPRSRAAQAYAEIAREVLKDGEQRPG